MRVGLVGWRGMVGSVLIERMQAEGDFAHIEPTFFHHVSSWRSRTPNLDKRKLRSSMHLT